HREGSAFSRSSRGSGFRIRSSEFRVLVWSGLNPEPSTLNAPRGLQLFLAARYLLARLIYRGLQRGQNVAPVGEGAFPDLAGALLGALDNLLGLAEGGLLDGAGVDNAFCLLAGGGDEFVRFGARLRYYASGFFFRVLQDPLLFPRDAARALDLLGHVGEHAFDA